MKQIVIIVFLAALTGSGCMNMDVTKGTEVQKPVMIARDATAPLPVFEDQITEQNAEQKVDEIRKELDYAADHPPTPPATIVSRPGSVRP